MISTQRMCLCDYNKYKIDIKMSSEIKILSDRSQLEVVFWRCPGNLKLKQQCQQALGPGTLTVLL